MDPPEHLRVLLTAARALGIPFEAAWPQAVLRAAATSRARTDWLEALGHTRSAWCSAYSGLGATEAEEALASIAPGHAPPRDPLDGRRCVECDRWLPADHDPRALFCPEPAPCRRRHNYRRERGEIIPAKPSRAETLAKYGRAALQT